MSSQYIFDKENFKFRKVKTSVWMHIRRVLMLFIASLSLAVLYYLVFALFFSTDQEKRLRQENRTFEQEIPLMEEKERLLSDVVAGLRVRDDQIYEEIFHASAPSVDPIYSVDILNGLDSIPGEDLAIATASRISKMETKADVIEENFEEIIRLLGQDKFVMPPMTIPMKNVSFAQTGASVGNKVNPFYKVPIAHNGLDLVASSGEPVYAAADGLVTSVTRSRKGLGNVVEIDHRNGYRTRYAHLSDIDVKKGRVVRKGNRIGTVGVSGNSFAPHLHYEVLRDTLVLEPINHFFASVTPEDYVNMLIMSSMTGQSMD